VRVQCVLRHRALESGLKGSTFHHVGMITLRFEPSLPALDTISTGEAFSSSFFSTTWHTRQLLWPHLANLWGNLPALMHPFPGSGVVTGNRGLLSMCFHMFLFHNPLSSNKRIILSSSRRSSRCKLLFQTLSPVSGCSLHEFSDSSMNSSTDCIGWKL